MKALLNNPKTTTSKAPSAENSTEGIDPQVRVRILIESAMEQSRLLGSDGDLVVRELAGELGKINATLSDVRIAVQELYQDDRVGAEGYLAYLAERGFPQAQSPADKPQQRDNSPIPPVESTGQTTDQTTGKTIAQQLAQAQRQEIARHQVGHTTPQSAALSSISFYGGNLIAELVANRAYSALVLGERRSGPSAILRAIAYDQIGKCGQTILDILDLHNGQWGGLEEIRLPDGSQIVVYQTVAVQSDIEGIARKLSSIAAEVRRRQQAQHASSLAREQALIPYLFLIDGLSEIHGALPGWSADRRSKDAAFSQAASQLRFVLCHGPAVGVSCVATARDHESCLCDAVALGETKLLFLGRISAGHNGGYRAIDKAVEDRSLLPSPQERGCYREALAVVKKLAYPVVFTPNGIPRLGRLANFSGYLHQDLLAHYQQALEVEAP